MIGLYFYLLVHLAGGVVAAKMAIAASERFAMGRWGPGGTHLHERKDQGPQLHMDSVDWSRAIFRAIGTFIVWPVIAIAVVTYVPLRAYFLPPVQRKHEHHVADVKSKAQALTTSMDTYNGMLNGEPPAAPTSLTELHGVIYQQYQDLMGVLDVENHWDGNFREEVKARIGWEDFKELSA